MFKKVYVISGITEKLANDWSKDFRKDLKLYRDKDEKIKGKISLGPIEAMKMKIAIIKYNSTHPCVLRLKRVIKKKEQKGKHYRD